MRFECFDLDFESLDAGTDHRRGNRQGQGLYQFLFLLISFLFPPRNCPDSRCHNFPFSQVIGPKREAFYTEVSDRMSEQRG